MTEIIIPQNNIDLEKLGLINQGLFMVDGELAQRYLGVLKKVFGFESDIDSFRVDKRGLSPELCDFLKRKYPQKLEFGENYLNIRSANRFMVVVSPDQKDAPLIAPQASYEDGLFNEVYRQARHTIEDLTESNVLFGEMDNGITVFRSAQDLLQFRTVRISLDTTEGIANSMQQLKDGLEKLGEGDNALNESYIAKMRGLVQKVGNVELRSVSDIFPIKREVHCFYVEFFQGIHCLRNFKNNKDGVRTIYISHHQERENSFGEDVLSFDLHNKGLLKALHKYGFLKYDPKLIQRRISEIEDQVLLEQGLDVIGMPVYERKRKVTESTDRFPKSWHELRDIAIALESTDMDIETAAKDACYETRLKLSASTSKREIIDHMLAELDPTDPVRVYNANPRKFRVEFPTLALNQQRYVAYTVLNDLKGGSG